MLDLLLASAMFSPQGPGTSSAPVVINEFSYDDAGTDDYEFVELYNRSAGPVDISGWKVVVNDSQSPGYGGTGTGAVPTHVIPAGTILAPGAFYLLGNVAIVPVAVPGVSQILPANSIENGGTYTAVEWESIELQDSTGAILDSLVYEMGYSSGPYGPHPLEGHGFFGDLACGGVGLPISIGRFQDGWDDNNNTTDFLVGMAPTPGATNNRASTLPYFDQFDTGSLSAVIPGWRNGFVFPKYVDPTIVDGQNLNAKPASPAGGLAMSIWDSTGGGNAVYLDQAPAADVVVETYAWFDPAMTPFNPAGYTPLPTIQPGLYNLGDGETWFLGVRGSCSANANPPDVTGTYFSQIALGVSLRHHYLTGIAWVLQRTTSYSRLYLVDLKDGAAIGNVNNYTILAGPIDIVQGVSDGWQRLRLQVQGHRVEANFGGTFGVDDGQRFVATTNTTGPGLVYLGYREALLFNNNTTAGCHPPLFDQFDVHVPTTLVNFLGTASPTSLGTPTIDCAGMPILGSAGFAVTGTGMMPLGSPTGAFCGLALGFATFAPGYPIAGAPPTATGYLLPVLTSTIGFASPTGAVSFPFPIPVDAGFLGLMVAGQLIDLDFSLPYPAPIGMSGAIEFTIGS